MSRRPLRLAALAGTAAVALGIATPAVAAAVEHTATIHSVASTATPISHAGRVVTVTMPTTHYAATAAHSDAVVNLAVAGPSTLPGINGQAGNVVPAYQQNVSTASATGTISIGAVMVIGFGGLLIFGLHKKEISKGWAFIAVGFGVFTGSTVVGSIYAQFGTSGVSAISDILSGM